MYVCNEGSGKSTHFKVSKGAKYWADLTFQSLRCLTSTKISFASCRGGSRNSGKGVHMYKGVGVHFPELSHFL